MGCHYRFTKIMVHELSSTIDSGQMAHPPMINITSTDLFPLEEPFAALLYGSRDGSHQNYNAIPLVLFIRRRRCRP
jgi:hypothetical protein